LADATPDHKLWRNDFCAADGRACAAPRATLAGVASDGERDEFNDAELDRLYAVYNGRDASGGAAGIGVQARDRLIRKLIDEVRRWRSTSSPDPKQRP